MRPACSTVSAPPDLPLVFDDSTASSVFLSSPFVFHAGSGREGDYTTKTGRRGTMETGEPAFRTEV